MLEQTLPQLYQLLMFLSVLQDGYPCWVSRGSQKNWPKTIALEWKSQLFIQWMWRYPREIPGCPSMKNSFKWVTIVCFHPILNHSSYMTPTNWFLNPSNSFFIDESPPFQSNNSPGHKPICLSSHLIFEKKNLWTSDICWLNHVKSHGFWCFFHPSRFGLCPGSPGT